MNRKSLIKLAIPAFYAVSLALLTFYAWNNQNISRRQDHLLYRNLMECEAYVKKGFDPAELHKVPNVDGGWALFESRPLWIMDAPLPGIPKYSHVTPRKGQTEEFTIVIPVEIDSGTIAFLNANPSALPGVFLASIGDNWEVYFNGTPVISEMHIDKTGKIVSHRFWRDVHFPIERSLVAEGVNILAFRIVGDPTLASTGLPTKAHYMDDYRSIKSRQHYFLEIILCGIFGFTGLQYLLVFLLTKGKRENFNLFFSFFSIMLCIYVAMRHGIINSLIPNSDIARILEFISLGMLVVGIGMFVEAIGKGKITKITRFYFVFFLALAFAQIFVWRHWGEEAIRLLDVTILLYYGYVVFYDAVYFYFWDKRGPRKSQDLTKNGSPAKGGAIVNILLGVVIVYISGVYEILDMLFFFTNLNLFIYAMFIVQIGMSITLSQRFRAMYSDLESTVHERNQLLARIETMLSHTAVVPKSFAKGSLSLDIIAGRAFVDNQDLLLTQKEFAVLLLLAQNEGNALSAESIYENVWVQPLGNNINTLRVTISNLRKKIEDSGYEITVSRGQGYTFERI